MNPEAHDPERTALKRRIYAAECALSERLPWWRAAEFRFSRTGYITLPDTPTFALERLADVLDLELARVRTQQEVTL